MIPALNNDSLFKATNSGKTRSEVGNAFAAAIKIDTIINIREYGRKIKIDEGLVWIFTVESKAAKYFYFQIEEFSIPEGAYLSFITPGAEDETITLTSESLQSVRQTRKEFEALIHGNKTVIEYFEPSSRISGFPILLKNLFYYFADHFSTAVMSKSGHGDAYYSCQRDVACESPNLSNIFFPNSMKFLPVS